MVKLWCRGHQLENAINEGSLNPALSALHENKDMIKMRAEIVELDQCAQLMMLDNL